MRGGCNKIIWIKMFISRKESKRSPANKLIFLYNKISNNNHNNNESNFKLKHVYEIRTMNEHREIRNTCMIRKFRNVVNQGEEWNTKRIHVYIFIKRIPNKMNQETETKKWNTERSEDLAAVKLTTRFWEDAFSWQVEEELPSFWLQ